MSLAVVADPDVRERLRCVRIIAGQTPVSALGVASWDELEQTFQGQAGLGMIVFAHSLPGAPRDAVERLLAYTQRVVLALEEGEEGPNLAGVTRASRPIAEEKLVLLARASSVPPPQLRMSFQPVDFLQMICMSGESQVLVLSQESADMGVIELRDGEVWTAFDGMGVGEDAFARLIRPEMRARLSPTNGSMKARTIFKGLHELVLESLHRIDEGQVPLPPKLSVLQLEAAMASPDQIAGRVQELTTNARRLLMERNYDDAARALILLAELDPASHLVRANLEQLRRLGYPK